VFNLGPDKLVLLFVIALIVLGPSKLPDAARTMGRALAEFRRISGSLQSEVREALNDPKDALSAAVADVRQELGSVREGLGGFGLSGGVGATADPAPWSPPAPSEPSPIPPSPDDPSLN
jgi:Tat protein translocase TatB subunit